MDGSRREGSKSTKVAWSSPGFGEFVAGAGKLQRALPGIACPLTKTRYNPMRESEGDEQLMQQVAAGDERAFRVLADRHIAHILRLAERTLGTSAEADDVAQETLIRIWQNAGRWRSDRSRLTTWIYTIVYRLCVDRLRRTRGASLDFAMEVADSAPGPLRLLSQNEDLHQLQTALKALQPRQRAAVTLFYYEGLDGEAAAEVLGMGLRAYWSLLHRARQSLHQQLQSPIRSEVADHDTR